MIDIRGKDYQKIKEEIIKDRGITNIRDFLHPKKAHFINPMKMENMEKAVNLITAAIGMNQTIGVHFDTDTDGIMSGTIVTQELLNYTDKVKTFTNIGKAHGLVNFLLKEFEACDVIIVVDSLDDDTMQYRRLKDMGKQVIILDHHDINPEITYDDVAVLVSSMRDQYPNHSLCGAGVCLKFALALDEWYHTDYAGQYFDLAAVGLIADMMDVSEKSMENRYIIDQGLKHPCNPTLLEMIGGYPFTSNTVSYYIAPLINAAGRVKRNKECYQFFLEKDSEQIKKNIEKLNECRDQQNMDVSRLLNETEPVLLDHLVYMYVDTPYEISGLVANSLQTKYLKPAFVLYEDSLHGSGRSPKDNFRNYCEQISKIHTGGHQQAFGIWFDTENKQEIEQEFEKISRNGAQYEGKAMQVDLIGTPSDLSLNLARFCESVNRISGMGFPAIKVKLPNLYAYTATPISKGKHTAIKTEDSGVKIINWNLPYEYMTAYQEENEIPFLDPIGTLEVNVFHGCHEVQMITDHLLPIEFEQKMEQKYHMEEVNRDDRE